VGGYEPLGRDQQSGYMANKKTATHRKRMRPANDRRQFLPGTHHFLEELPREDGEVKNSIRRTTERGGKGEGRDGGENLSVGPL